MRFSPTELAKAKRFQQDLIFYAKNCLWIRTKDGPIEPFVFNRAQNYIHQKLQFQRGQTGKVRALILKGRQQGCSTYVGARFFHQTTHRKGCQAFILTHALDATSNLFKMARRYYEHCPVGIRPDITLSNVKELVFGGLDSGYKVGTAENKSVGRSSTVQLFHGSEVAFWNNADDHAAGIMQSIPESIGSECILESTANGVGGYFHQMWQRAEAGLSDYISVFVPWFWQEEYQAETREDFALFPEEEELKHHYKLTNEQLQWRRMKILNLSVSGVDGHKVFKQEYPFNAAEAFQLTGEDSYIDADIIMRARKVENIEKYGPIILGVDPARFGDDRTSIIRRQGRVAYGLESYSKRDTMEVTGIVHKIIQTENVAKCIIDVGGLGAGVYDRLVELGYQNKVVAANSGNKPLDGNLYVNKRAEMWSDMKKWLQDEPCQIPDDDSLHADLCNIKYRFDSNTRLLMERKEDMKKRGVRSCDEADALALTFYMPPSAIVDKLDNATLAIAKSYNQREQALMSSRGIR
jgi:hypothetical protein